MSILAKKYVTTMTGGSRWAVCVGDIALSRAEYYAKEFDGDVQKSLREDTLPLFESDEYEIEDWAQNNMNWSDVRHLATCISHGDCDYEEGWCNGDHIVCD